MWILGKENVLGLPQDQHCDLQDQHDCESTILDENAPRFQVIQ